MANKCKECAKCNDHDVHLHVEIENLKQQLVEKENHIVTMETNFLNETNKFPSGELIALREELVIWQDKYRRLYDAHRRVQRVNQGLEDKLLKLVDVCETEKNTLTKDVGFLSEKLSEANYTIKKLTEDNERYKMDVSLAIQFLQCKQSNFVAHKFNTLPQEVQAQVSSFLKNKKKPEDNNIKQQHYEPKSIKVPIPTFPPTAMVYSVTKYPKVERKLEMQIEQPPSPPQIDIVSAAIMAKVLEERQKEKACRKHCDSCTCLKKMNIIYDDNDDDDDEEKEEEHHSIIVGTQTDDYKNLLCLRCNDVMPLAGGVKIIRDENKKPTNEQVVKVLPNNFLSEVEGEIKLNNSSAKICSNNILLDNVHQNNVASVLYTRNKQQQKNNDEKTPKTHNLKNDCFQLQNNQNNEYRLPDDLITTTYKEDDGESEMTTENQPIPISDNARRYAEMEENVKRFLFGEQYGFMENS